MPHFLTGDGAMIPANNEHAKALEIELQEVLKLVALVMERPAAKKTEPRATLIAYVELQRMRKSINRAIAHVGVIEMRARQALIDEAFPPVRCTCEGRQDSACPVHGERSQGSVSHFDTNRDRED